MTGFYIIKAPVTKELNLEAPVPQNGNLQTNFLSVFDQFVELPLKGLKITKFLSS